MPTLEQYLEDKNAYPDSTSIRLADGVETTLGSLRSGFMKDADYRRKTSELSERRKAFDSDRAEWEVARLEAEGRLTELAKTLMTGNPGMTRQEADEELEGDPRARKLIEKLERIEAKLGENEQRQAIFEQRLRGNEETYVADQHRKVLQSIKAQDPDVDVDELINYARSHYIGRLDDAYRSYRHDHLVEQAVKKATEDARKEAYEKAKQDLLQPVIPSRRAILTPVGTDAPKNLDEAADAALQDPEILKIISGG